MSTLNDIKAKTYEEILLTQYTNCVALLVSGGLSPEQKEKIKNYEADFKKDILKMMEGRQ